MRRATGLIAVLLLLLLAAPATPASGGVRASAGVTAPAHLRARLRIAPGVVLSSFQQVVGGRSIRYYVTRVAWRMPGVGLALLQPPQVDQVRTVRSMVAHLPHAIVGVNGDFFDVDRTGAPLGLGVSSGQVQHGVTTGWNSAFWVSASGRPAIGTLAMTLTSPEYPSLGLTNLDSPQVSRGGIGVYDAHWGVTSGYEWTGGQTSNVLAAHILDGRVADFETPPAAGQPVVGSYLIARGGQAVRRLHMLQLGSAFSVQSAIPASATIAVTGSNVLLENGATVATDNSRRDPRTGVGVDYRHGWLFFVVVEGREKASQGLTLLQFAQMFGTLGCTDALNLDGGSSSTLVARRRGRLAVINMLSNRKQRKVANGLAITYVKPG